MIISPQDVDIACRVLKSKLGVNLNSSSIRQLEARDVLLLLANLLKRDTLTDFEKSAILFSLVGFFSLISKEDSSQKDS